ncbi:MAG: HEPN domain-containing protein [Thermoproteota archaeon]|nr:HEPN domain-containing protein [Candidatus Brockarchaeota archaeon]
MLGQIFRKNCRLNASCNDLLRYYKYVDSLEKAQEAVELMVKGILDSFAIQYPREHDVSDKLPEAYIIDEGLFNGLREERAYKILPKSPFYLRFSEE